MHAYLITGADPQIKIKELINKHSVSEINTLNLFPETSLGIESIREIIHNLTFQTVIKGEVRAVVVHDAHTMTEPAQNAFLKTLEEPPADTIIILTARREDSLLPTILSRCVLISTQTAPTSLTDEQELFKKLISAKIGGKVQFAEETGKDREQAIKFVQGQIAYLHTRLHENPDAPILLIIEALERANQDLSHNVNPKMVLFELLRHY